MDRLVIKAIDARPKIFSGLELLCKPVASTLGPKGGNVLYVNDRGESVLTNDGVTIAKEISSSDQIEDAIIEIVKQAALRTNNDAGDGTTTTSIWSEILVKEGLKLLDLGYSWIEIRSELKRFVDSVIKHIEKNKIAVTGKKGIKEIATISANNDAEIAGFIAEAVDIAKEDGMVFIQPNPKSETEITKDLGFMVRSGIIYQELLTNSGSLSVLFKNTPVLLTDKKIYYPEEAETILRTAVKAGHKSIVVVARDFMGEAVNTFIANHAKGIINVMLVKMEDIDEKNNFRLVDLATYLGGSIVTEKTGSLVNNIKEEDFVIVTQVFSDPTKTLFTPKVSASKALKDRIAMLKETAKEEPNNDAIKERIAALTTGVVTLKVGGSTPVEIREKIYRYEDAINATRSAMRDGYLVGGGMSLLNAVRSVKTSNRDFEALYKKLGEAIIRQIATNSGKNPDSVIESLDPKRPNYGYNALTDKFEDLLNTGVIDPFMVIKMVVENSVSVAMTIISISNFVINDETHDNKKD